MVREEKIILGITGISHLLVHSTMLVLPSILILLQQEYQIGLAKLGLIVTASLFMFGLGSIPAGLLERKLGGRNLLLIYQSGIILSILFIVLTKELLGLVFGLILLGLFSSIYHPAGLTLISRRVKNISSGMAFHGIMGSTGLGLGPIFAGVFASLYSWRVAYLFLAILFFIILIGTLTLIPARKTALIEDKADTKVTNKPALITYYSVAILIGLSFAGFTTFMPTHFAFETRNILPSLSDTMRGGIFTSVVLLSGIIGQIFGGYLGNKFSRTRVLFWIIVINIPFLFLIGFSTGIPLILIGIIFGVAHFTWQPIGNSLIAQITHSHHRGLGYGIGFFLGFGVGALAAGIGGLIGEYLRVAYIFPVMAVILIPAIFLTRKLITRVKI